MCITFTEIIHEPGYIASINEDIYKCGPISIIDKEELAIEVFLDSVSNEMLKKHKKSLKESLLNSSPEAVNEFFENIKSLLKIKDELHPRARNFFEKYLPE
jgi:hypothetical protein